MSGSSLKRSEMLKSRARISEILDTGRRFHGRLVSLYYVPSERMAFAVLIGRRVGKPAQRTRVKRWIRASYRTRKQMLHRAYALVVLAQKPFSRYNFQSLDEEIHSLLSRIDTQRS